MEPSDERLKFEWIKDRLTQNRAYLDIYPKAERIASKHRAGLSPDEQRYLASCLAFLITQTRPYGGVPVGRIQKDWRNVSGERAIAIESKARAVELKLTPEERLPPAPPNNVVSISSARRNRRRNT